MAKKGENRVLRGNIDGARKGAKREERGSKRKLRRVQRGSRKSVKRVLRGCKEGAKKGVDIWARLWSEEP